jgi:hypothetical protein
MTQLTKTNIQVADIDYASSGSLAPVNNGVIVNWNRGGSTAPVASSLSRFPTFLIPASIFIALGMILAQAIGGLRDVQLAKQNTILTQQIAQQSAQIEGVKSLVCNH